MNSSLPATEPTSEYETKVKTEPLNWPSSLEINSVQGIKKNQIHNFLFLPMTTSKFVHRLMYSM